jgi:hypothetical protein
MWIYAFDEFLSYILQLALLASNLIAGDQFAQI